MDIEKSFRHTKSISETQKDLINAVENLFIGLASNLNALPESREKSLCMTKLQEAKMWCVEGIAKDKSLHEM